MSKRIEMFLLGRKAALAHILPDTSSDEWGRLQRSFAKACRVHKPNEAFVCCVTLWPDQVHDGVHYSWGLAGPDGAWFEVYRMPHQTQEDVKKCRNYIRLTSDVVSMTTHTITEWLPMGEAGLGQLQLDPNEVLNLPTTH